MADNQELQVSYQWRLPTWFPDLAPEQLKQLKIFHDELLKFNRTLNLVAPKTLASADVIHFADSILASRVIASSYPKVLEIYDLGSGGGFPGVIFAFLNRKVKVHLIEQDQKKCEFLKHIVATLGISNADVLCTKIEQLNDGSVQFALARGLSSITKTILPMRKIVPTGGAIFHLKGDEWSMEVSGIPIQLCSLWAPSLVGEYRLPMGEARFSIIKTDKIS